MFEGIINFFKKFSKTEEVNSKSKDTAKERLHLVLMQDRANVSADFLEMMKQEIIEVIKKYIDVDEKEIDVKLTNKTNEDGSIGAPALYANIPITKLKNENIVKQTNGKNNEIENKKEISENSKKESNKKNIENVNDSNVTKTENKTEETDEKKKENSNEENDKKNNTQKSKSATSKASNKKKK